MQTILLLKSAFLCVFRFFGLSSFDTVTTLILSRLVSFHPFFEVIPEIFYNFVPASGITVTQVDTKIPKITKMKKIQSVFIILLTVFHLSAQMNQGKYVPFHFSFIPPLSSNGINASQYTNGASFSILAGMSANERNFTFASISNVIANEARGLQFAGISNYIGKQGQGVAFAGMTNITKGTYKGVQLAGITNYSAGESRGIALAGLNNAINGNFKGVQFAGLLNTSKDITGLQFAGLLNIAGKVRGVQFAGLLNIAEESDCPIGLVNIVKRGEMGIALTYDILGNGIVSFRSGGKYTYGIIGFGYNHKLPGNNKTVAEAGYGVHIPCYSWFQINNEFKVTSTATSDKPFLNASYSLLPSFKIKKHYNIFGGASLNYSTTTEMDNQTLFPQNNLWKKHTDNRLQQLFIGYLVGIQYIF